MKKSDDKIRVLLADDHAIVREGLRQLLNSEDDVVVVGEAEDGQGLLEESKIRNPDVILLDIAMPGISGLDVIPRIKEAVPDSRIVIFTMYNKKTYVHQALAAGALGYVLKASPSADLIKAIRAARCGEYYLSHKVGASVIETFVRSQKDPDITEGYDLLSSREQQVFRLMVEGHATKEIADILCVSPKTVEKHRSNLMDKLDIHDLVGLVKYAIRIGIINPDNWEG